MSALCSLLFFESVLQDSLKLIGLDPVLVNLVAKITISHFYHGDTFSFCSFSTCARTSSKRELELSILCHIFLFLHLAKRVYGKFLDKCLLGFMEVRLPNYWSIFLWYLKVSKQENYFHSHSIH